MSQIINLIDDQPKIRYNDTFELVEDLMKSIWSILRKNWTLHKYYINNGGRKKTPSGYQFTFSFTSICQGILKIFTIVQILLADNIILKIQSKIGSDNPQIIKILPELQNSIMEFKKIEKSSSNLFGFSLDQQGINIYQKEFHSMNISTREYAKKFFEKVSYCESFCQKVIKQLSAKQQYKFAGIMSKKEEKAVSIYESLALEEKENQKFRIFYKQEANGQSLFKNIETIPDKKHQILRLLKFHNHPTRKEIQLSKSNNDRYKGSYSSILYIQDQVQVFNTFFLRRKQGDFDQSKACHVNQTREPLYTLRIIRKIPTQNPRRRREAQFSLMNEKYFLLNVIGNSKSPFLCNFYLNIEKNFDSSEAIYSDFHRQNVHDIFYGNHRFTMLDILNFSEQLIIALIGQYLDKGFLHRDIKSGNILLSRGIIQIIDNGAVYPFDNPINNKENQVHKNHLDSKLRTTYIIEEDEFIKSKRLTDKYHFFSKFYTLNSRHRTFDVYSVGRMLKEIIESYEKTFSPKWMQISVMWHRLIQKMTEKDFKQRIQMENVLEELKNIRKTIFGKD